MKVKALVKFDKGSSSYNAGDVFELAPKVAEQLAQDRLVVEYDEAAEKAADKAAAKAAKAAEKAKAGEGGEEAGEEDAD